MAFTDNFARANGLIGANWYNPSNYLHILNNRPSADVPSRSPCQAVSAAGPQTATLRLDTTISGWYNNQPMVKSDAAGSSAYLMQITGTGGNYTLTLYKFTGSLLTLATALVPISLGSYVDLRLVYNSGTLTGYVNDTMYVFGQDATFSTASRVGCFFNGAYAPAIMSFTADVGLTTAFSVSPTWAITGGAPVLVTFSGVGTTWTAGNPGSPTFTTSAGSFAGQAISSPTTGSAWFTPPAVAGSAVVTDPSTGLTATISISGTPPVVGGFAPLLTPEGAASINAPAALWSGAFNLTNRQTIFPAVEGVNPEMDIVTVLAEIWHGVYPGKIPGQPDFEDMLILLWKLINGEQAYVAGTDLAAELGLTKGLASVIYDWLHPITNPYVDVNAVVDVLGGAPTIYSNADIMLALGNISSGSNQDVLDALAAYFGSNPPTIEQLGTMVSDLATIAGYNLGDVRGWIEAIPSGTATDLSPVLNKLALIQPTNSRSLDSLAAQLATTDGVVDTTAASLSSLRGSSLTTLQDVLDAIAAIAIPTPSAGGGPPIWPGAAGVDLDAAVVLTPQLHLTGSMDGVIVSITTPPNKSGLYHVGGAPLDYGQGRLAFETDSGDLEPWQYTGFRSAIYTPKSMARASGARFQVLAGAEGTVTPWRVSG